MVILLTSKISPSSIMQCYSCFLSCFDFSCQINFVYKYIPLRGSGLYKPLFSFGFPCHFFFIKVKVTLFNVGSSFSPYGTAINGSRRCALYPPLPLSVLCFTGIQSYSYTDQRKVEADVEVTEDRTGDLSLRKPRTSQLSHECSL